MYIFLSFDHATHTYTQNSLVGVMLYCTCGWIIVWLHRTLLSVHTCSGQWEAWDRQEYHVQYTMCALRGKFVADKVLQWNLSLVVTPEMTYGVLIKGGGVLVSGGRLYGLPGIAKTMDSVLIEGMFNRVFF